jgi:heme-degrading monooxygenase HmoA
MQEAHLRGGYSMEIVLVDKFVVPEESKPEFFKAVHLSSGFLKTLPGFVEGYVYEKRDANGGQNVMTTAVWKDEEAFQAAKKAAAAEFQKRGFNPADIMKKLRVEIDRAVYNRSPY